MNRTWLALSGFVLAIVLSGCGASAGVASPTIEPCYGFRNNQPCGELPILPTAENRLCQSVGGKVPCAANGLPLLPTAPAAPDASDATAARSSAPTTGASSTSPDCVAAFGAGTFDLPIDAFGKPRDAVIHIPPQLSTPDVKVPAVIAFHGYGGLATDMASYTGLSKQADAAGFVVVYPQAVELVDSWSFPGLSDVAGGEMADLAMFDGILARLSASGCIDMSRIFLAGHSNGGGEVSYLACRFADRIAGAAIVAGEFIEPPCVPQRPVPIIAFHSIDDPTVPYAGGALPGTTPAYPRVMPVETALQDWATLDGCSSYVRDEHELPTGVTTIAWEGCDVPVVLYRMPSGGHEWPGAIGRQTAFKNLSATAVMWTFFSQQASAPAP